MKKLLLVLTLLLGVTSLAQDSYEYKYKAKIISVYDGDTCTAEIDLGFNITLTEKLRFHGIDAPEVRGSERREGLISRDRLRDKILNQQVIIKTHKKGKYGRYIAEIYLDGVYINKWLVDEGLAEYRDY